MRILMAGAMGEVGRTVAEAMRTLGHDVLAASARAPIPGSFAVTLAEGAEQVLAGRVDLVVNAAGPGDRRPGDRQATAATDVLGPACGKRRVPGVLLSTTRVLEGHRDDFVEDAEPAPRTPYAEANADNERRWWRDAGAGACVLRITNYFCPPSGPASPQTLLLPWSLVTEALTEGRIGIRSGPGLVKEFVGPADVASAVLTLAGDPARPHVVATTPGTELSMQNLADCVVHALARAGRPAPSVTFGPDTPRGPTCGPGWLDRAGWAGSLTRDSIEQAVADWVIRWAGPATAAVAGHEGG